MSKLFLTVLIVVFTLKSHAQNNPPAAAPPSGPLLAEQAPEFSAWTATYSYTSPEPEASEDTKYRQTLKEMADADPELAKIMARKPQFGGRKPRISKVNAVKTGKVKKEITVYSTGVSAERWVKDRLVVQRDPFAKKVALNSLSAEEKDHDFPDFAWISSTNFKGFQKVSGKDCMLFEDQVAQVQVEDGRSYLNDGFPAGDVIPVKAMIDAKTRLPVSLEYLGIQRAYTFGSAPSEVLSLPADLAIEMQNAEKRRQSRNATVSPP